MKMVKITQVNHILAKWNSNLELFMFSRIMSLMLDQTTRSEETSLKRNSSNFNL